MLSMTHARLVCGVAAALATLATLAASPARADDPHIPNQAAGQCAGGGGGSIFEGWCDGAHYPDGSYWHQLSYAGSSMPFFMPGSSEPTRLGMSCVVDPDNGPIPQPAPPGGCGGAQK